MHIQLIKLKQPQWTHLHDKNLERYIILVLVQEYWQVYLQLKHILFYFINFDWQPVGKLEDEHSPYILNNLSYINDGSSTEKRTCGKDKYVWETFFNVEVVFFLFNKFAILFVCLIYVVWSLICLFYLPRLMHTCVVTLCFWEMHLYIVCHSSAVCFDERKLISFRWHFCYYIGFILSCYDHMINPHYP